MKKQYMLSLLATAVIAGMSLTKMDSPEIEIRTFVKEHAMAANSMQQSIVADSGECIDEVSFAYQIKPLIDINCASCHNFSTHESISENAALMLRAMRAEDSTVLMPLDGPALPDAFLQQFSCWINQGKLNN